MLSVGTGYAQRMVFGGLILLVIAGIGGGLLLLAGGIVLLVLGSRRRNDSTSRPFLAFGVALIALGLVVGLPAAFSLVLSLVGSR